MDSSSIVGNLLDLSCPEYQLHYIGPGEYFPTFGKQFPMITQCQSLFVYCPETFSGNYLFNNFQKKLLFWPNLQ